MEMASNRRSIQYYNSIASRYDAQMDSASGNRWIRDAFRQFVTLAVPAPALVLDFGSGTGIDTAWLAVNGYEVIAYDNSSGMMKELGRKCGEAIDRGRVVVCEGSFPNLIATLERHRPVDAVIANFAVFNLIPDLRPVFSGLAPHVVRGGHVLLSVLNPIFWKDLGSGDLWAAWRRSFGRPAIHVAGRDTDLYRHWVRSVRRAAEPHFTLGRRASVGALVRRYRGSHSWQEPRSFAERLEARTWTTFPMTRLGQFFFLSLRRRQ